jgi:hypothetical protein
MSEQNAVADMDHAARNKKGKQANRTRRSRLQEIKSFVKFLWKAEYQINTVSQIKEKHIFHWVDSLHAAGLSHRTIANKIAHVRACLNGAGRGTFAQRLTYERLGIAGASREGTKVPMARAVFQEYLTAARQLDQGVAMCLELQEAFGCRAQEAVMSVKSLRIWEVILTNKLTDGCAWIVHGTKGGRSRRSPPVDREQALDVVSRARALCKESGGVLIRKPDLKKAMGRYHAITRKIGMTGVEAPHSLRYQYAVNHLRKFAEQGYTWQEAAAATSTFLGHGDGRGRWVMRVYGRTIIETLWPEIRLRRRRSPLQKAQQPNSKT